MNDMEALERRPPEPIPEPLRAAEVGTFTHYSVVVRLPNIGREILADNDFVPAAAAALEALVGEIPEGEIRRLLDRDGPDSADWDGYVAEYEGLNWLEAPWFFVECYFYRRVLEASGYFQAGHPHFGVDPFAKKKREGLAFGRDKIQEMVGWVDGLFAIEKVGPEVGLQQLLAVALWGNQADLSLWPAGRGEQPQHESQEQEQAHLLADDSQVVVDYLLGKKGARVDVVLDNAGFELISDLCLTDFLLFSGLADSVCWHLKAHPTFVSDAMIDDVRESVGWLSHDSSPVLFDLGRRLQAYLEKGRWTLSENLFWTSPRPMWEMTAEVRAELGRSDLIIMKGDANYRRLLGDRHWPFTRPFGEIVSYTPAPLLALRAVKSEVAAGLTAEKMEEAAAADEDWMTSGRWGVVQMGGDW
jgi:hypothetical protein